MNDIASENKEKKKGKFDPNNEESLLQMIDNTPDPIE